MKEPTASKSTSTARRAAQKPRRAAGRTAPAHAARVPFAALVAAIVLGGLALLLGLNTASAANELRRHDLSDKDASVAADLQQANNEIAASSAPNALASAAAALGMVPGGNPAFITIGPDGKPRILGSPAAATPIKLPPIIVPASTTNHVPSSTTPGQAGHSSTSTSGSSTPGGSKTPTTPSTPTPTTTTLPGGAR